jgi:hypothetical protein
MFGRRPVYISTLFAFMFFIFPCALAEDISVILVCRFFAAMVGCSVVSNSPGTINDVSTDKHRAFTFSIWCLGTYEYHLSHKKHANCTLRSHEWACARTSYRRLHLRQPGMAMDPLDSTDTSWCLVLVDGNRTRDIWSCSPQASR